MNQPRHTSVDRYRWIPMTLAAAAIVAMVFFQARPRSIDPSSWIDRVTLQVEQFERSSLGEAQDDNSATESVEAALRRELVTRIDLDSDRVNLPTAPRHPESGREVTVQVGDEHWLQVLPEEANDLVVATFDLESLELAWNEAKGHHFRARNASPHLVWLLAYQTEGHFEAVVLGN